MVDVAHGLQNFLEKSLDRSCLGLLKNSWGGACSKISPKSMNTTRSATSRANPISWVTHSMVMPSRAKSFMTFKTSLIISGSSAEVGSSKSMMSRLHGQGPGDGHALLLAAGEFGGVFVGLLVDAHPFEQGHGDFLGLGPGDLFDLHGGQGDVFYDREVGVEVELLEDDADVGAQFVDVDVVAVNVLAVDEDMALLVFLQAVHTPDQGGFPGSGRATDDQHLARVHGLGDALEHVEVAVPLVHVVKFDQCHE